MFKVNKISIINNLTYEQYGKLLSIRSFISYRVHLTRRSFCPTALPVHLTRRPFGLTALPVYLTRRLFGPAALRVNMARRHMARVHMSDSSQCTKMYIEVIPSILFMTIQSILLNTLKMQ